MDTTTTIARALATLLMLVVGGCAASSSAEGDAPDADSELATESSAATVQATPDKIAVPTWVQPADVNDGKTAPTTIREPLVERIDGASVHIESDLDMCPRGPCSIARKIR